MSMEYGQEFQREYSDKEEEEEEDEVRAKSTSISTTTNTVNKLPSSSSGYSRHQNHHHDVVVGPQQQQQQNQWLIRRFESPQDQDHQYEFAAAAPAAAEATNFNSKLQLIELSLKSSDEETSDGSRGGGGWSCIEREHMFDKVVTPSDVGKLNRLVIPKQHAEKYFPLDSSTNEKGLLLNFEDRNGKPWRFRYSYWNSSQSYVMTKGWSRFVKEKKLDAGDVVSFQRGVGESGKNRLYIDWRRRPYAPPNPATSLLTPLHLPSDHHQQHFPQSIRWAGRLYSMPPPPPVSMPLRHHDHLQYHLSSYNNNVHPYNRHHHHQQYYSSNYPHHHHSGTSTTSQQYDYNDFLRSSSVGGGGGGGGGGSHLHSHSLSHQIEEVQRGGGGNIVPMVIESVPVGRHGTNSTATTINTPPSHESKRLRLFGVNMEYCPIQQEEQDCDIILSSSRTTAIPDVTMASQSLHHHHHLLSSSLEARLPNDNASPQPSTIPIPIPAEFLKKGKSTSLSFPLDP